MNGEAMGRGDEPEDAAFARDSPQSCHIALLARA